MRALVFAALCAANTNDTTGKRLHDPGKERNDERRAAGPPSGAGPGGAAVAAEFGEDGPGRSIYARPEPDDHDGGERAARIKVGAVLTRHLHAAEATETPSGAAYGNPLRGRPERAPSVPVGSALLARPDALDAPAGASSA